MQCGIIPYIPCKCDLATEDVLILLCNQVHYEATAVKAEGPS